MIATTPVHHGSRRAVLAPALAGVGLVVLVIGTFLPWLRSGATERNSYAAGGVIRRLLAPDGAEGALLTVWPLIAVLCAAALAGYALGFHRSALIVAAIPAIAAGAVSIDALLTAPSTYASVTSSGPAVTLAGTALVLVGVLASLFHRRAHRSTS